jgi:hypothetical protein
MEINGQRRALTAVCMGNNGIGDVWVACRTVVIILEKRHILVCRELKLRPCRYYEVTLLVAVTEFKDIFLSLFRM